ncbi:hypothetical protein BH24ACT1_BH24ACT1_11260 [soil metagenome]
MTTTRALLVILALSLGVGVAMARSAGERALERPTAHSNLSELVAATPDGATLTLSGQYEVSAAVEVADRHNLTIEGDGTAVVRQIDPEGEGNKVFLVTAGANITFRDFEIAGANPVAGNVEGAYRARTALGSAIAVKGTRGIRIEGMDIHDTWGDFVDLDKGPASSPATTDVVISGNTFQRNGRQGVSLSRLVNDVRIEDNQVSDVRRSVFDIEHAQVVTGIDIVGNRVDDYRRSLLFVGRGGDVSDLSVTANTVTGPGSVRKKDPRLVEILSREPTNPVRGVLVCDNDADRYLDVLELSGATDVTTTC